MKLQMIEGSMAQAAVSLTKLYRNRSHTIGSTLLLFAQETLSTFSAVVLLALLFLLATGPALQAHGQTTSAYASAAAAGGPDLPDAPSASPTPQQSTQSNIPFMAPRLAGPLHPMDIGDKFKYLVEPAFGPRSFFITNAFGAGIRMANPPGRYPREWRSGAEAFGRNYGDSFARTGAESIGRFSTAVLLHEDPRYRRSESTFVPTRLGHAFVYTFVDKTDGGRSTIAVSNFTGAAAAGFIGNAYLPAGFDNLTHAGQRASIAFGSLAAQNVLQEFSPELSQALKKIHFPHIPLPPIWWTGGK